MGPLCSTNCDFPTRIMACIQQSYSISHFIGDVKHTVKISLAKYMRKYDKGTPETIHQMIIMIYSLLLEPLALLAFSLSPSPFPSFLSAIIKPLSAATIKTPKHTDYKLIIYVHASNGHGFGRALWWRS
jgi:hypothetical protein